MHNTGLEDQLRSALRDEADRIPMDVEVGRLNGELSTRRRAERGRRLGLLAAGIGIVAFGLAAFGLIRQPSQAGVGATPSPSPAPSARSGTPFAIDMLEAPSGEVMIDRSTPNRAPEGTGGDMRTQSIGSVAPALQHHIGAICLGEGDLQLSFGQPETADHVYTTSIPCDGVAHDDGLTSDFDGSREVIVEADEHAAWRVIVTAQGEGGAVIPTTLHAGVAGGDRGRDVEASLECAWWLTPTPPLDPCDLHVWPPIVGSPVTLAADDELLVSIGEAWAFAPVEVSAIPADADLRSVDDVTVPLYSGTPGSGRVQVPLDLGAGTWFVRVVTDAEEQGGDQAFHADWYLKVELAP